MELRHLRYFAATAVAGSVSKAARQVHVTQPSMSRQLRQLEQDLGVALFERTTGRLALSRTGQAILPAVRDLLAAADALKVAAALHAHGKLERLTIAAPTVTLTDVVSPFVATMNPDDPVVDVLAGDGLTTAEMLDAGADLAIGTSRPVGAYETMRLAALPVWAYVRRDDPWSARGSIPLTELLHRPLVVLPAGFTAREALDAALAIRATAYTSFVEAANGTIAQALAAAGRGVAVVSDDPRFDLTPLAIELDNADSNSAAGNSHIVDGLDPDTILRIRLIAVWKRDPAGASTIAHTAERLRDWVTQQYEVPPES